MIDQRIDRKGYLKEYYSAKPWMKTFTYISNRVVRNCSGYKDKGIKSSLTHEELKTIWFRDKAYEMKQPSIDRIDASGNYELSNCRYVEKKINEAMPKCRKWYRNKLGITFEKKSNKWRAQFFPHRNSKNIFIGRYKSENEAIKAREEFINANYSGRNKVGEGKADT